MDYDWKEKALFMTALKETLRAVAILSDEEKSDKQARGEAKKILKEITRGIEITEIED